RTRGENMADVETMRHSAAHVLAAAVERLYPGTKLGVGPTVENGFYYDMDVPEHLTPEDLPRIEDEMRRIVEAREPFVRDEEPMEQAIERFRGMGQDYKVELLRDLRESGTIRVTSTVVVD